MADVETFDPFDGFIQIQQPANDFQAFPIFLRPGKPLLQGYFGVFQSHGYPFGLFTTQPVMDALAQQFFQ